MIPHGLEPAPLSRRDALAAALGGEPMGDGSLMVGDHVIWASLSGVVRMNGGIVLGCWDDGTEALAAAYREVVASW